MTSTFDWSAVAPAWGRYRDHAYRTDGPVIEALLAAVSLQPGHRVLEVAAGTGELALRMSGLVGTEGRVVATDAAKGMVALAEEALRGTANASAAVADATDTRLAPDSVDAVVCCMGLMFVQEPARALQEWVRVLAPGGRLAAAVWAGPQHNPWLSCLGMAAMANGLVSGGPPLGPGGLFSLGDASALETQATKAGLADFEISEVAITFEAPSVDDYFDHVSSMAGPLAVAIANATAEQRAAVRSTADTLVAPYSGPEGVRIPGLALVLSARV